MKQIKIYINEKLHVTTKSHSYSCHPKTLEELREIIIQRIENDGSDCDLNDIDVSKIENMSYMFCAIGNKIFEDFNGDVSMWNVSNVKNMECMFWGCVQFNGDMSEWDVSNVTDMSSMFSKCENFNGDISQWDVSSVIKMQEMFSGCKEFNCDLSDWNMSKVENIQEMFKGCKKFRCNLLSNWWDVSNAKYMNRAFKGWPTKPKWYDRNIRE